MLHCRHDHQRPKPKSLFAHTKYGDHYKKKTSQEAHTQERMS